MGEVHRRSWAAKMRGVIPPRALEVLHVGSTAVPGLPAKPILDVDVVIAEDLVLAEVVGPLEAAGWRHRGDQDIPGHQAFRYQGAEPLPAHHLYVCRVTSPELARHVAFRELLRPDAALRDAYAALKYRLASRHRDDRAAYTEAQGSLIRSALEGRAG